jgi:hypothetical protein
MSTSPKRQPSALDPVKLDPDHYKVEFENDRVRVLRVNYGPRERSVMHSPRWDWAVSHISTLPIRFYEWPINRKPFQSRRGEVATGGNPPSGESRRSIYRIGTGRAEDLTGSHVSTRKQVLSARVSIARSSYGKE